MTNILKVRTTGRRVNVYLARAVEGGEQQMWFKDNIGDPVGSCVKGKVKKGMSIGAIHKAVKDCSAKVKGLKKAGAS